MASLIDKGERWADIRRRINAGVGALLDPSGAAGTLIVEPSTGDDSNCGRSMARPKRTILAAYDALPAGGGTIICADPMAMGVEVGGEVADQGIWLAGGADPQFDSLPPGWRPVKPVTIVGVGGQMYTGAGSQARARVGVIGGSATDVRKPTVWLSRTTLPVRFVDLYLGYERARPILIGVTSDLAETDDGQATAGIEFDGCAARVAQRRGCGPGVEVGYAFDLTFRNCSIDANFAAPTLTDDTHAAILVKPRGYNSTGLFRIKQCGFSQGGLKYYRSETSWSVDVEDLLVEGDFANPTPPPVWLVNPNRYGFAFIKHIAGADAPGTVASVLVDGPDAQASTIVCVQVGTLSGPATVLGAQVA
jgi:hypothetical protein